MLQIIMLAAAWLAVREGPRLMAAAIAVVLGYLIAHGVARTADSFHRLTVDQDRKGDGFDRKPTREQWQALRADLRAALDSTLFASLLPQIAARARRDRTGRS